MSRCAEILRANVSGVGWIVDEYYQVPDKLLGSFAVLAMGHATTVDASNDAWADLYQELYLREFIIADHEMRRMSEWSTFCFMVLAVNYGILYSPFSRYSSHCGC